MCCLKFRFILILYLQTAVSSAEELPLAVSSNDQQLLNMEVVVILIIYTVVSRKIKLIFVLTAY